MSMIPCLDLTICLLIKVDSPERADNFKLIFDFLSQNLDTSIDVLEVGWGFRQ